jgi:hypothetical protein
MTKSLEETFDLPPLKEALAAKEVEAHDPASPPKPPPPPPSDPAKILNALTVAEKIEHALTTVTDLDNNDGEMDEIAQEALESYAELKDLAMNMADAHAGRMMEVAASMLKTSLEAKEAKINRKLKTIDLQLKKMRMDRLSGEAADPVLEGTEFDRNELLKHLHVQREE